MRFIDMVAPRWKLTSSLALRRLMGCDLLNISANQVSDCQFQWLHWSNAQRLHYTLALCNSLDMLVQYIDLPPPPPVVYMCWNSGCNAWQYHLRRES